MNCKHYKNVINYPYIDNIVRTYVPELIVGQKLKRINMDIFIQALTHYSYDILHYDRLEYLGDAIFHLVMTDYLLTRYDEEKEGFLTKLRIRIERGDSMAHLTKAIKLDQFIRIGNVNLNQHILEDVFEAFIGAFYVTFGMEYTQIFITRLVETHKNLSEIIKCDDNYKDILLIYFHKMKWGHPIYQQKNKHVENGRKYFISEVVDNKNKIYGIGRSNIKVLAEQAASKNALINLGIIIDGVIDDDWKNKIEQIEPIKQIKETTDDKKKISIYNKKNVLITIKHIKIILSNYKIKIPSDTIINVKLFREAMTHKSYVKRTGIDKNSDGCVKLQPKSNDRLKFLGDAIIHFIIGDHLYSNYPDCDEGFLTRLRCKLENRDSLYELANCTEICHLALVSQNIELVHGRTNVNIIGGCFEAFIGAVYLNFGLDISKKFLLEIIKTELNITEIAKSETNYKDLILQLYNKKKWGVPVYKILEQTGPDHSKMFKMGLMLGSKIVGTGSGSSKKKAEQLASMQMYNEYMSRQ